MAAIARGTFLASTIFPTHLSDGAKCNPDNAEMFWAEDRASIRKAVVFCRGCPVQLECRTWAKENNISLGVWGGVDMGARKRREKYDYTNAAKRKRNRAMDQVSDHGEVKAG